MWVCCSRTAPMPPLEALVWRLKALKKSGWARITTSRTMFFNCCNLFSHAGVQIYGVFFWRSWHRGRLMATRLGTKCREKLINPRKLWRILNDWGGANSIRAVIFARSMWMLASEMRKPKKLCTAPLTLSKLLLRVDVKNYNLTEF